MDPSKPPLPRCGDAVVVSIPISTTGVVQGQVRDRKRVKLGRVREEKEKFLSLTEFPDNLSLVSYLDYCNIFAAGRFYYSI